MVVGMSATIWTKFFWSDHESDPALRQCSLAAQGLWMRLLCICARSETPGFLTIGGNPLGVEDVAKLAGITATEVETLMAELDRWGVFSRDRKGRIYSRRIVREVKKSKEGAKHGKKGGNPTLCKQAKNVVTLNPVDKGGGSPHIPKSKSQLDSSLRFESNVRERSPDDEFVIWYSKFPHKVGRGAARKAFSAALKKTDLEMLLSGLARYIEAKPSDRKWCNPATWLNEERWLDQEAPVLGKGPEAEVRLAFDRIDQMAKDG